MGAAAPLAWVAVWVVLTPALVSGTLLAAAGGLLFGTLVGTALTAGGATLGGVAAFALARRFGQAAALDLVPERVIDPTSPAALAGLGLLAALGLAGVVAAWRRRRRGDAREPGRAALPAPAGTPQPA